MDRRVGPHTVRLTLAGGRAWVVGSTPAADIPVTPGALMPGALGAGLLLGAFLAAADFATGGYGFPAVACVLDSGNLSHVRPEPFEGSRESSAADAADMEIDWLFGAFVPFETGFSERQMR